MRTIALLGFVALVSLAALTGCGKTSNARASAGPVEEAFKSADAGMKEIANKAATDIKAANYPDAFSELLKLNQNTGLTSEQRKVVQSALHDVAQLLPPKPAAAPGMPAPPQMPK